MSINEKIIVSVFQELVKHKPRLALLLPDDEEDETDIRQLVKLATALGFQSPVMEPYQSRPQGMLRE